MGQLIAKNVYYLANNNQVPDQKHATCQMANGKLAFLVLDPSVGGGFTNPRAHVYVANADRTVVGAPLFWNYSNVDPDTKAYVGQASMAIDASGNLHVVYVWHEGTGDAQSVRYRKLTYNSGTDTFTLGSEVIVSAAVSNRIVTAVDIDSVCTSADYPMVLAAYRSNVSAPFAVSVVAYNRTSTGWNSQTIHTTTGNFTGNDICLAVRQDADVAGVFQYVVTYNPGPPNVTTDPGDSVYIGRANVGGTFVAGSVVRIYNALNKNVNAGYRAWEVFWLSNDAFVIHCVLQSAPSKVWFAIIQTSATSNTWSAAVAPRTYSLSTARWYRFGRRFASASLVRDPASPQTKGSLVIWQVTNDNVWARAYNWEKVGSTWSIADPGPHAIWNKGYTVPSTFLVPWAGERGRFSNTAGVDVLTPHYQMNSKTVVKRIYLWKRPAFAAKVVSAPAENATIATNTPDISVDVTGVGADSAAIRQRVQVQVSNSSSFASGVFTITQPTSSETYYTTSRSTIKISLANYPLVQGVWYARVRMIDQFGGTSSWSDVRKFSVSHPPSAINLSPRDGAVLVYNAGGTTFNWRFADAYSADVQTAYQIDVYNAITDALIVTSNKVSSSTETASVVIPSSALESELKWFVTVWDGDDVSSAPASGGTVLLTQPPAPIIDYPEIDGDDVPTAIPTIAWTPGVTGSKVQVTYRVQIRADDQTLLYDTRVVESSDTSLTLPAGILRNNRRYRLSLAVTDSTKLETTVTRIFDTAWPIPVAMPRPDVFLDNYDTDGFATVQVSTVGIDPDVVKFHLYRRSLESSSPWQLVHEIATTAPYVIFKDYFLPAGVTSEYVMTQQVDRFGDLIESSISSAPKYQVKPENAYYWLINATVPELSLKLQGVTSDSYTPEIEETTYTVIGRGRQVEVGEDVGITGTLSARLRDQNSGGFFRENYNFLKNPNFEDSALGDPENWDMSILTGSGSISADSVNLPPGPGNRRDGRLRITANKTADVSGTLIAQLSQTINKSPYFSMTLGLQYFASVWFSLPAEVSGYSFRFILDWCENNTVRQSETVSTINTGSQVIGSARYIESRVVNGTIWYRLGKVTRVPYNWPGINNLKFRAVIQSDASGTVTAPDVEVDIEAAVVVIGTDAVQYFSGYEKAGEWTGVENVDPSFTVGCYSARKQRQRLMTVQNEQHEVYLRNPFGDIWLVHVGNMNIDREASLASSEGVNVEIPYFELRRE